MFSKDKSRFPDALSPTSLVVASPKGSPGFRIRRYLTSRIDKHPARKLNYESPNPKQKTIAQSPAPKPPVSSQPNDATMNTSVSTLSMSSEKFAVEIPIPDHELLHQGNKLFWRINRTLDFRIYLSLSVGAIVVRSFDSVQDSEFPPIILEWAKILPQIKESEAATAAHQAALNVFDKQVVTGDHGEDDVLKQRRRKKDASRRKSEKTRTAEDVAEIEQKKAQELEADRLRELDEMRGKVVSFIISRFEATKDKESGLISTNIIKRPSDTVPEGFLFDPPDSVPAGVDRIGQALSWNKKENTTSIRRKSTELLVGLQEANEASKKASEKQVAIQAALDIVKLLSDRDQFNSLSSHHQKFQLALRKAVFQTRLEKTQGMLAASDEYKKFAAESINQ